MLIVGAAGVIAQEEATLDGRPVRVMANDKLTLAIRSVGGAMVQMLLKDDPDKLNPLQGLGHFVCVDGFGPVSAEERAAGLPGHGEAHRVPWDLRVRRRRQDGTLSRRVHGEASHRAGDLPPHGPDGRRRERGLHRQRAGEPARLRSPVNWGEHATIGGPFLEQGKTVTEMSAKRAMTRSYESEAVDPPDHHNLADFKEFTWPMAPTASGGTGRRADRARSMTPVMDQTTSLMDPSRRLVFVTAFHPEKRARVRLRLPPRGIPVDPDVGLVSGRGSPFVARHGVRRPAFDLPRRDVIQTNSMFDTPTYRWLPALSTIRSSFVMFYTRTPEGFTRVSDVVLENGKLTIEDRTSGKKTIVLNASRGL